MRIDIYAPGGSGAIYTAQKIIESLKSEDRLEFPHYYKLISHNWQEDDPSHIALWLEEINNKVKENNYNVVEVHVYHEPWGG